MNCAAQAQRPNLSPTRLSVRTLTRKNWFADPDVLRTLLYEYAKYVGAAARDMVGMGKSNGLRGTASQDAK